MEAQKAHEVRREAIARRVQRRAEHNRVKSLIRWSWRRKIGKREGVNPKRVQLQSKIEGKSEPKYIIAGV